MKYNKHLKAIGIKPEDMPSNWFKGEERQREDENGFREVEFYNLETHLAMYIYSYLCEFRENYNCRCPGNIEKKEWDSILDKMIKGFEIYITTIDSTGWSKNKRKQMDYGMRLFIKYFSALWD